VKERSDSRERKKKLSINLFKTRSNTEELGRSRSYSKRAMEGDLYNVGLVDE